MDADFLHEQAYLKQTKALIRRGLADLLETLDDEQEKLLLARQEFQENQPAFADDRDKQTETAQYLSGLQTQMAVYQAYAERLKKLHLLNDSPYFGRIDFAEPDGEPETYYIGRASLRDPLTYQMQICDWRTPMASLYYRSTPGPASFMAPEGEIAGSLMMKRQYEIAGGELLYYFDTDVHIKDGILRKLLSQKASSRMKAVVESLQDAQDRLIRQKSRVLLIQGSAGSGKTSLALHRAAFLMYQDYQESLTAKEILIISPNPLFSSYIDRVLPELGEENISSLTFQDIFAANSAGLGEEAAPGSELDDLLAERDGRRFRLLQDVYAFKYSAAFAGLLARLADYYERRLLRLPDVYYNHRYIATGRELKEEALRDRAGLPLTKRLEQIRRRLSLKIHEQKKRRLPALQEFVGDYPDHQLEIVPYARLLSMKRGAYLSRLLDGLVRVDVPGLYKRLWGKDLFYRLAKGLTLPDNIEEIRQAAESSAGPGDVPGLFWLRLLLEGAADHPRIRQVIVDEAQDYGPIHYMLLKKWFPRANFTILGDVQQSLSQPRGLEGFRAVGSALGEPECPTAILRESFRSTWEIGSFCRRFVDFPELLEPFSRHGQPVEILSAPGEQEALGLLLATVRRFRKEEVGSIAVICKTSSQAAALYAATKGRSALQLVRGGKEADLSRSMILPLRLVKGLEFDGVILWDVGEGNYGWLEHKRLLYLAASRALHRLALIYHGRVSPLVPPLLSKGVE
ncbi:MAG: ATP-binding domain-containing protein [Clostridiales bacterium]|nr:ATP-binding domain-containing protein [Clostridiales bacterium]